MFQSPRNELAMASPPASWDLEVDVVAVGSGLGGLTAALAAHAHGASVVVLEKAPKVGGICAYSGGEVFVPCNHKMQQQGIPDDPAKAKAYFDFLAGGYADEALAGKLFELAPQVAKWLDEACGVRWKTIKGFPDYHHPHAPGTAAEGRYLEVDLFDATELGDWQKRSYKTPHMPQGITHDELFAWGSLSCILQWDFATMGQRIMADKRGFGPGMMAYFIKAALIDRAIPCHVSTPVRELVLDGGKVVGVRAEQDGKSLYIAARRGVVMAIGGYDWHPDFAKYYEGLPEWKSMVQPSVEGDNLIIGGEVGAATAGVPSYNLGMFFGYRIPGEEHDGAPLYRASWEGGYPHALWVNRAGKRFCDESFYREYLPRVHDWDGVKQEHPNYPPFLIFDAQYREEYPFATYMPGRDIPESMVAQSDTPRGLAEKLGIDADAFEATLERFNSFADGPTDPDFGRGSYPWAAMMVGDRSKANPNMGTVAKPPFYGIPLLPVGVGINAVGLKTDDMARVQHLRGHAIDGLYACGNSAAALDTGAGYQSGLSNLRGMVWGYVAGQHAATR